MIRSMSEPHKHIPYKLTPQRSASADPHLEDTKKLNKISKIPKISVANMTDVVLISSIGIMSV